MGCSSQIEEATFSNFTHIEINLKESIMVIQLPNYPELPFPFNLLF